MSVEVTTGTQERTGKGPREQAGSSSGLARLRCHGKALFALGGDALDLLVATARCWRPWHGYEEARGRRSIGGRPAGLVERTPREVVET